MQYIINQTQYRCLVCGYIEMSENVPEICPVCGVTSEDFEEIINYE